MNDSAVGDSTYFALSVPAGFECHARDPHLRHEGIQSPRRAIGAATRPSFDDDRGRAAISPGASVERLSALPTLRNVAKTGPIHNNGSLKTLGDVLDFYSQAAVPVVAIR